MRGRRNKKGSDSDKNMSDVDFDTPTASRKGLTKRNAAEEDVGSGQDSVSASRGYFVRRSLRERDLEEEERQSRPSSGKYRQEPEEEEYYEEESSSTKAPKLVRIFAWVALLAVFFTGGYAGANYLFKRADRSGTRIGGVVGSSAEVRDGRGLPSAEGAGEVEYKLYLPKADGDFEQRNIKIRKGLPEEDIQRILTVYSDGLKEMTFFEPDVRVLNIFRSGDWLYVDMSQAFLRSLKAMGRDNSTKALTGLVRTMQENFPPIKKVKFYVDGKESREKNPIDIENAWEIKS